MSSWAAGLTIARRRGSWLLSKITLSILLIKEEKEMKTIGNYCLLDRELVEWVTCNSKSKAYLRQWRLATLVLMNLVLLQGDNRLLIEGRQAGEINLMIFLFSIWSLQKCVNQIRKRLISNWMSSEHINQSSAHTHIFVSILNVFPISHIQKLSGSFVFATQELQIVLSSPSQLHPEKHPFIHSVSTRL